MKDWLNRNWFLVLSLLIALSIGGARISAQDCSKLYLISETRSDGEVLFGYIDLTGKIVVKPQFRHASEFVDGVAVVSTERKAIGKGSNADPSFEFSDAIINKKGEVIKLKDTLIFSNFSEGLALARVKGKFAYVDTSGRVKIFLRDELKILDEPYSSPEISPFSEGTAALQASNGGVYLIAVDGTVSYKPTLGYNFDDNGLAIVEADGEQGLLDRSGKYVFGPQKRSIEPAEDGYYTVPENSGQAYHFVGPDGRKRFELTAEYLGPFSEGLAKIQRNGKWGYVDPHGNLVVDYLYDDVKDFSEGLAAVSINDQWGFINRKGDRLIALSFTSVEDSFDCGLAYVSKGNVSGYIDKTGKWIWSTSH